MRFLLKIYSACCLVLVAFSLFFLIPFESLPFSTGVFAMITGGVIVAAVAAYVLKVRHSEGFEFGWFLANRGGFWFIAAGCLGLVLLLSGFCLYLAPERLEPAFERGSWPVAGMLVILFWFALIFMFAVLSFTTVGQVVAYIRARLLKKAVGTVAIGLVCLFMAALFFSLFLEVVNDVFLRISVPTRWTAIWIFTGVLVVVGIFYGGLSKLDDLLDGPDLGSSGAND